MFFSQLRPVQFSQPKKLSSSRWPKPSDSSPGLNNSPVQNHFPTIFQAFSKHFPSILNHPIGWLGDPRGRSEDLPVSQRLCRSRRVSWATCFRCFLKSRSWRVWRGAERMGSWAHESIRKCGFYHDLTMIEPWFNNETMENYGLNLIEPDWTTGIMCSP